MFIEEQVLSNGLLGILRHHVAQRFFDFMGGIASGPDSITKAGNVTSFAIPMIFPKDNDIPRDHVESMCLSAQVKLAWDIKKYVELLLEDNPRNVSLFNIVKKIPITIVNKRSFMDPNITSRFERLGINIVNTATSSDRTYSEVEDFAKEFASFNRNKKEDIFSVYSESRLADDTQNTNLSSATNIKCKIHYVTGNNATINDVEYILSVKVIPKYVDSAELLSRFSSYDARYFYRQLVKLEKGEINFFTGLLLDLKNTVDKAKYAANRHKDPVFEMIDKFSLLKNMMINICPFLMIGLSENFVKKLLETQAMDVEKDIKDVLKSFCAMGMFIYRPERNAISMFYDGDVNWATYGMDAVISDTERYARELRELVKFTKH